MALKQGMVRQTPNRKKPPQKTLYLCTNYAKVTPLPMVPGPPGCWTFGAAAAPAGTGHEDASGASPPPPLEGEELSETPEKSAKQHRLLVLRW